MDYKDAFNVAYYNAIDDGMSEEAAELVAHRAYLRFTEQEIDRAEYLMDCARERGGR